MKRKRTLLNYGSLTIQRASVLVRQGKLSPSELIEAALSRIDTLDPILKAWVVVDREKARRMAKTQSKPWTSHKRRGLLYGIPVGIKDIFLTSDFKTEAGSRILADFSPNQDATAVAKIIQSGGIILGKTETTEFASFDPARTRNPWNLQHTPGGSSSGSAVAVATGMCLGAIGSQTAGSTIRPAAYCGIVGLKPTFGRISRHGMIPASWSLDHVGIFAKTVQDAGILLEVLAGFDPLDVTSLCEVIPPYSKLITRESHRKPRLGLLREYFNENATERIRENFEATVRTLRSNGAHIAAKKLPRIFAEVAPACRIRMISEVAAIHEQLFRLRKKEYGPKIRQEIEAGLRVPVHSYLRAQKIKNQFASELLTLFSDCDCLVMPSTPSPAPKGLGSTGNGSFNVPWSFAGYPALTIPTGLIRREGLPMGLQLVGRPLEELTVLRVGHWCERVIGFDADAVGREGNLVPSHAWEQQV